MRKLQNIPNGLDNAMMEVALPLSLSPNHRLAIMLIAPVVIGEPH